MSKQQKKSTRRPAVVRIPWLSIVYATSAAVAKGFNPGDLVFDTLTCMAPLGKRIKLVILSATEYWKEVITAEKYVALVRPATYATEQEVLAAGGTTHWDITTDPVTPPTFAKAITLTVLVKNPKGTIVLRDATYTLAKVSFDKLAYRHAMCRRTLADLSVGSVFTLQVKRIQRQNGCPWYAPKLQKVWEAAT